VKGLSSAGVIRSSLWNFQRRMSEESLKSHSLETSLSGIVCLSWNCDAENSVVCFTGCAHSKVAILLFLKSKSACVSCEYSTDLFVSVFTDPAPVLEASHSLEERLQQLQTSAPHSEALVREISGHWKKHLECLEKTGHSKIRDQPGLELNQKHEKLSTHNGCFLLKIQASFTPSGPTEDAGGDVTEAASESSSPHSLMTPNSTPAPGAPSSPQQNHQGRAGDRGWEPETNEHTLWHPRWSVNTCLNSLYSAFHYDNKKVVLNHPYFSFLVITHIIYSKCVSNELLLSPFFYHLVGGGWHLHIFFSLWAFVVALNVL